LRHLTLLLLCLPLPAQGAKTITTPKGVKIEWLAEGKPGTAPVPSDRVKVHYTGRLADGTKFDSTLDRQQPHDFLVGGGTILEGWDECITHMDVGSKCKVSIPAALAYGAKGNPQAKIPADADLVYEIEVLEVLKGTPFPAFRAADPEKQQATGSGLKWETIREGSGEPPGPTDIVELRLTAWDTEGRLVFSSDALGGPVAGEAGRVQFTRAGEKFLPEAVRMMRPGGACRVEVPPEILWGDRKVLPRLPESATSVWQVEFLRTVSFAPPDPAKAKKTESGLEYEVVREGTGAAPTRGTGVAVHYTGWLENGSEFDSSHRRGQPAVFGVEQVIKGWTEGLQLMREGAIYRFRIPAPLAYGDKAMGDKIPANSTLIFEVELLRANLPRR
jgi:FKBP-type peptidyl-prolyl cis-trans isomerase